MARGGSRASGGMEKGGCEKPNLGSRAYLPQGFLSGRSVLQAHVQPSQLQPHGGHVEGVPWVMLAGRGEKTTGHLVRGRRAAHGPGAVSVAAAAELVMPHPRKPRPSHPAGAAGACGWSAPGDHLEALHCMQFVCF